MGRRPRNPLLPFLLGCLALAGCRQDMHDQAKFEAYEHNAHFADGRSARQPVDGTVARGEAVEAGPFETGHDANGQLLSELPVALSRELLDRGRERYNIFCSPCHSVAGDGNGMIVRRGFKQPESFHSERLLASDIGYFFDVMTRGFGQMSSYASQVPVEDRWAIAAYLRALQFSQSARLIELPAGDRQAVMAASTHQRPGNHGPGNHGPGNQDPATGHGEDGH